MNASYGFSGWMIYTGTMVIDGMPMEISSSGDIFGDLDCCLPFSLERTYLVSDCAGNATTFSYTIARYGVDCLDNDPVNQGTTDGDHNPVVLNGNGNLVGNKTPIAISSLVWCASSWETCAIPPRRSDMSSSWRAALTAGDLDGT